VTEEGSTICGMGSEKARLFGGRSSSRVSWYLDFGPDNRRRGRETLVLGMVRYLESSVSRDAVEGKVDSGEDIGGSSCSGESMLMEEGFFIYKFLWAEVDGDLNDVVPWAVMVSQ
tara:strand:- start:3517 stop:3861 length:345 start_codon:yes stop_codon:yes gene_type:complete